MKTTPKEIDTIKNREVLNFLSGRSCHGDIIEPLEKLLNNLPEIKCFCPDGNSFSWCCWYTNEIVFAFGVGMHEIGLRLLRMQSKNEKRPGSFGGKWDENEWWLIKWDSQSLEKWALMAYEHAKRGT